MESDFRDHVAFYLTGRRPGSGLGPVEGLGLSPAILARYGDLTELRYDYPLVLVGESANSSSVISLSGLFDDMLEGVADGPDAERVRHHALRLEREMRKRVEPGSKTALSALWQGAEQALADDRDPLLADSLSRLRSSLRANGEVVDCDRDLPATLLTHIWRTAQEDKARRAQGLIDRLVFKLSDILRSDDANSTDALEPDHLRASLGRGLAEEFDFGAMSRLLATARPLVALSASRRARIQRLLSTLESQTFFQISPATGEQAQTEDGAYRFVFRSCADAIDAYRERFPRLVALAKAMAAAELEIEGEYREDIHDAMFERVGGLELGPGELAWFPDYLVEIDADSMTAIDGARLTEALAAGLPMKILLQTDDLGAPPIGANGHLSALARARQTTHAAIGIGGVFVLQTTGSHLYRFRKAILRGLAFEGPALFSIYSGAGAAGDLPPYLASAAALESRAFPAFTYDPSAGPDWASRFSLEFNPQADRDWPTHPLSYEEESLQRASADVSFTFVDFLACDRRYSKYFATVPKEKWNGTMIPVPDCVTNGREGLPDKVPYVLMVDANNVLHRVIVDEKLIRESRRCREHWRSLQELGGINNSHAVRLLAGQRAAVEERARRDAEDRIAAEAPGVEISPAPESAPADTSPSSAAMAEPNRSDEPFIETPRCSSCNECIKINDRMFKYDRNKQAYIADLEAGTYAQLVQAAESCQVAVIHPGKPRNPNESGLEALLERAKPFLQPVHRTNSN